MSRVLTFDLGTTYFKSCLIGDDGAIHALARRPTPIDRPHEGWRQITLGGFFQTLTELADELRAADPAAYDGVRAISFATQANSFTLLAPSGEPLTPLILWNDTRAHAIEPELQQRVDAAQLRRETGVPGLNREFSLAKLLWLRREEPTLFAAGRSRRRLLFISDVLTCWLTGAHVTEAGVAGLSTMLDIHTLRWRRPFLEQWGIDLTFPRVRRAGADLGPLQPAAAKALRLRDDTRLILGCLDQYAGAIGAGNVTPGSPGAPGTPRASGRVSETTGTVLATVSLHHDFRTDLSPGVFQGPAWRPGLYWRMCFGNISAGLLEALARAENKSVPQLVAEAEAVVNGQATRLRLDRDASAARGEPVFLDARPDDPRGLRVRAILQAVADALRDQVLELRGEMPERVISVGGAAKSDYWRRLKAETLGVPVDACRSSEAASLGAAALGWGHLSSADLPSTMRRWAHASVARV